jgi:glycosyltransferase involved in cell wall biosynthesis
MTCKNRLTHVKETLPLLFAEASSEDIVFVDYLCSEGSGSWVQENFPKVKTIFVEDDPFFCVARARNMGAKEAKSEWLFFIDADIKVKPGLVRWIKDNVEKNFFYRASEPEMNKETWGSVLCMRDSYKKIDGYDEVYRDWGGEDDDLYQRFLFSGIPENYFPNSFVEAISHDDEMRLAEYNLKKSECMIMNIIYSQIKYALMKNTSKKNSTNLHTHLIQPNFEQRKEIMNYVKTEIKFWTKNPDSKLPSFQLKTKVSHWLLKNYNLVHETTSTFKIVKK